MIIDFLNDRIELDKYIASSHYADIAEEYSDLDEELQLKFSGLVDEKFFANMLVECSVDTIIRTVDFLPLEDVIKVVNELKSDDAVDIIGYADFGKQKAILNKLKRTDQHQYKILLGYDKESAGGLMSTEFVALKASLTVESALKKLREIEEDSDDYIDLLYIVDDKKRLIGVVTLKKLILSDQSTLIEDIMDTFIVSVRASEDQEEVASLVQKYDISAIPVVNNNETILGIVTVDDVIDVIIEEQSEDLLMLGGVSNDNETTITVFSSIKARLPWLTLNLFTAFLSAYIVSRFDKVIGEVVALAAAMPIVAGMGGNAGTQALSVMIRNITINDADLSSEWKTSYREVLVGLFNGLVVGLLAGLVLALLYGNVYLGIILLLAMIGNLIIAGVVGSFVPLVLKKLGFDPALASSIFITTATDVFGFLLFLGLAATFIKYLN